MRGPSASSELPVFLSAFSGMITLRDLVLACPTAGGVLVAAATFSITLFEEVEDGYLLAFTASGSMLGVALRAIVGLDPWQRRWVASERAWWISQDAISLLARHLPLLGETLDAWRRRPDDLSAYITSGMWNPQPRRIIIVPPEVAAAYHRLGLTPGAGESDVAAARRGLARAHHPDSGGDHRAMVAINTATDTVMDWLDHRRAY